MTPWDSPLQMTVPVTGAATTSTADRQVPVADHQDGADTLTQRV